MSDRFNTRQKALTVKPYRFQTRPARFRRPATYTRGPRWFEHVKLTVHTGGPGLPPANFVTGTTSGDEWVWYWASMRVLDPNRDPRMPPFYGGELWKYQSPEMGMFTRALGSAVVDFLYLVSFPPTVVRIQTYYFHLAAPARQQAHDFIQKVQLAGRFDVVDVPSQAYIGDDTGETACIMVKEVLGLVTRQDPLTAGTALLVRNPLQR